MTDLKPKARALVQAGRTGLRATAADRARVEVALRARLGPDALPLDRAVTSLPRTVAWKAIAGVTVGVGVLGAVALLTLRPAASLPVQPHLRTAEPGPTVVLAPPISRPPSEAAGDSPPTAAVALTPAAPARANASARKAPVAHTPSAPDRLAHEVALLSRATSELHAGDAAAALRVLAEHQRTFPRGALVEERRAAKAQALCLLGRVRAGRAELTGLTPLSPAAARVRQVCDGASSAAGDRK